MTRRRIAAAALVFTLFGIMATLPPLVTLFQLDMRVFGVPLETIYIFALWAVLVAGASWFSRALPDDRPRQDGRQDRRP